MILFILKDTLLSESTHLESFHFSPLFSIASIFTLDGKFESSADAAARGDAKPGKVLITRTLGTAQTVAGTVTSKAATATYVVRFSV